MNSFSTCSLWYTHDTCDQDSVVEQDDEDDGAQCRSRWASEEQYLGVATLQVADEGEGVHAAFAGLDLLLTNEVAALKNGPVGAAEDAARLDFGLGYVHVEGVEGKEDALVEDHGGSAIGGADLGAGRGAIDHFAACDVVGL